MPSWGKKDHTNPVLKAAIRTEFLPPNAQVLDLFCGRGTMYDRVYQNNATGYVGIDRKRLRKESCFIQVNNQTYIKENDLNRFNVFDLDAYGCPWKLLLLLGPKLKQNEIIIFLTDGVKNHLRVSGCKGSRIVRATERLPKDLYIPSMERWYTDMFNTMLLIFSERSGYTITKALYVTPSNTVFYWILKMRKAAIMAILTKGVGRWKRKERY